MKTLRYVCTSLLLLAMLVACGGLPKEAKEKAKGLSESSKKTVEFIADKEKVYLALMKGANAQLVGPYAKREKWGNKFNQAKQGVKSANSIIEESINPLLKRNKDSELSALYISIGKVNRLLREAKIAANYPTNRAKFLFDAQKHSSEWLVKAKGEVAQIDRLVESARLKSEQAKTDAKKYAWPKTGEDLDRVFNTVKIDSDKAHQALDVMNEEVQKTSSADYASLGDSATAITTLYQSIQKKQPAFLKKTDELYRSYAKTLEDMRIEYYVKIGRASWDDYSDWDTTKEVVLVSGKVSEEVYSYFANLTTAVATFGIGWSTKFDLDKSVSQLYWNALGINPKASWPNGHDEAEYWVADVFTKTFHKYTVLENEKEMESEWIPVKEDFYWMHEEHLGMTIYSKPYGMYESEAIKDAVPQGMQYIAKPNMVNGKPVGENKYGKWETNSSGHSFFHYYGMYHFLFGGNTYGYNDYGGYRSHSGSYYGNGDRFGTYGSATYRDGSRYSRSSYAKRNPGSVREVRVSKASRMTKTTRSRPTGKVQKASVRGAGSANRGRGASGKGGK